MIAFESEPKGLSIKERGGRKLSMASSLRPWSTVAWTVGKAVNEKSASFATRHHRYFLEQAKLAPRSAGSSPSPSSSYATRAHQASFALGNALVCTRAQGVKQLATQFHSAARQWLKSCESHVQACGKRRALSTKTTKGGSGGSSKREAALAALKEKEEEALSTFFHEPKGPVTAVEGASYSVVIAGGLAIAATLAYYVVTELLLEKPQDKVYNKALDQIKLDPRVMVRLGSPIKGYGSDSRSRRARQRISHRIVKQEDGTEHCQVQFQASGPNGRATVHADMFEKGKDWEFAYLIVDVTYPPSARARINVQTNR